MPHSLGELRQKLTPTQRQLLSEVWHHRLSTGHWISARRLHKYGGGKPLVWPELANLGGTVVFEIDDPSTTQYGLTFLGIMLSSDGERLERTLVEYLTLARQLALDETERTHVHSREVSQSLGLADDQVSELGVLLLLTPLSNGGSYSSGEWNLGVPRNIEDIPEDLPAYVSSVALEGFDPAVPVSHRERGSYQASQGRASGAPRSGLIPPISPLEPSADHPRELPAPPSHQPPGITPESYETALESYTTLEVLGEGGSGRVFLVRDTKGSQFAIKYLHPELVSTERVLRFKNELSFSLKNTHQNILSVVDHGFVALGDRKVPFYVMPLFPTTLRKQITEGIPPEAAFQFFLRMIDGVEVAHRRGIWHRDLKPENVLLDPSLGKLVIADFGIAHFAEEDLFTSVHTQRSDRLANFTYAAPEQRRRGKEVDSRADIYALGLILNEIFTGDTPLGTGFTTVAQAAPAFAFLDPVVDRMIQQSPMQRFPSLDGVREAIAAATRTRGLPLATVGPSPQTRSEHDERTIYRAEVDSAGRLDNHSTDTVLCVSAGLSYSLLMPAQEKATAHAYIAQAWPAWGKTRQRVLLYTALIYLLLRDHLAKLDVAVIDIEYQGYEGEIKGLLLRLFSAEGRIVARDQIRFQRIDRTSPARKMASRVYRREAPPDLLIGAKAVVELLGTRRIGAPGFTDGRRS